MNLFSFSLLHIKYILNCIYVKLITYLVFNQFIINILFYFLVKIVSEKDLSSESYISLSCISMCQMGCDCIECDANVEKSTTCSKTDCSNSDQFEKVGKFLNSTLHAIETITILNGLVKSNFIHMTICNLTINNIFLNASITYCYNVWFGLCLLIILFY